MMAAPAIPPPAVDAQPSGMRRFETGGNWWTVREIDGRLGFEVAGLPPVWIDAPDPFEQLTDRELLELARAASEAQG